MARSFWRFPEFRRRSSYPHFPKRVPIVSTSTPGLYDQWGASKHFRANVGCYECHRAEEGDPDAFKHVDFLIATIVSPKDCGRCHSREVEEFSASRHATAAEVQGSYDHLLGAVVEGKAAEISGCQQCHGSRVEIGDNGRPTPSTWPNTGIGRINPDGSRGACSACHSRHTFAVAQARRPENCGKCHLGPDHPQREVYEESKHGIAYYANMSEMHLDDPKWVVGEDYSVAPTCATCHMSATKALPVTHDVSARISWTLRPMLSEKIDAGPKRVESRSNRGRNAVRTCSRYAAHVIPRAS